jgi:hypothetical protein
MEVLYKKLLFHHTVRLNGNSAKWNKKYLSINNDNKVDLCLFNKMIEHKLKIENLKSKKLSIAWIGRKAG